MKSKSTFYLIKVKSRLAPPLDSFIRFRAKTLKRFLFESLAIRRNLNSKYPYETPAPHSIFGNIRYFLKSTMFSQGSSYINRQLNTRMAIFLLISTIITMSPLLLEQTYAWDTNTSVSKVLEALGDPVADHAIEYTKAMVEFQG